MTDTTIGRYQVTSLLGEGGMGQVYRAFDPKMRQEVAVKVLHHAVLGNAKVVERFGRELRVLLALRSHPNIVTVLDYVEEPFAVVMELLQGRTLHDILAEQGGALPLARVLAFMRPILEAVGYAHDQQILHRDVKSANIMVVRLGKQEQVKVMDFGLAGFAGGGTGLTRAGARMGTPGYMAPEQFLGRAVDERTDIYALGILLYELSVGSVPFDENVLSEYELMRAHVETPLPVPSSQNPAVPAALDAIVLRATQKDPAARYPSCEAFLEDLRRLERGAELQPAPPSRPEAPAAASPGPVATPARPTVLEDEPGKSHLRSGVPPEAPPIAKSHAPWIAAGVGVGLLAVVAIVVATMALLSPPQAPTRVVERVIVEQKSAPPMPAAISSAPPVAAESPVAASAPSPVRPSRPEPARLAPASQPTSASQPPNGAISSYRARLSSTDHVNSKGARLDRAASIVAQDRANYHYFDKPDPDDQGDPVFTKYDKRRWLGELLSRDDSIPRDVARTIVGGTPLVEVTVWSDRATVRVVEP